MLCSSPSLSSSLSFSAAGLAQPACSSLPGGRRQRGMAAHHRAPLPWGITITFGHAGPPVAPSARPQRGTEARTVGGPVPAPQRPNRGTSQSPGSPGGRRASCEGREGLSGAWGRSRPHPAAPWSPPGRQSPPAEAGAGCVPSVPAHLRILICQSRLMSRTTKTRKRKTTTAVRPMSQGCSSLGPVPATAGTGTGMGMGTGMGRGLALGEPHPAGDGTPSHPMAESPDCAQSGTGGCWGHWGH